jgi:hypothetical protein
MMSIGSYIFVDAIKAASLVHHLVTLPLHFIAAVQPLGPKATTVVDMLTSERVGLGDLYQEVFSKNINNITKLTLFAATGAGGLMVVCFLGAALALVLGLTMIPVVWTLLAVSMVGALKAKRAPAAPEIQLDQPRCAPRLPAREMLFSESFSICSFIS